MTQNNDLLVDRARFFNQQLPERISDYLNKRGISNEQIDKHLLGWNGYRITIPIFSRSGELAFFKYAKDPEDKNPAPKMFATTGAYAELYGWENLINKTSPVVICEGEFDRLVLETQGIPAVTSTAGAVTFRKEWADEFATISDVYICFDRDEAGQRGTLRVGGLIPHAKIITLPVEVGEGGDVTDFFVRLGKTKEDFLDLMIGAQPGPDLPTRQAETPRRPRSKADDRVERIKSHVAIEDVVQRYIQLRKLGTALIGLCPFHPDTNPSFAVYPATRSFYCFGCSKYGDVITFVMEIEHLGFLQALERLEKLVSTNG
jgi:DNA primase